MVTAAAAAWLVVSGLRTRNVDWTLHGARVTPDGEIIENMDFTLWGVMHDYISKPDALQCELLTPKDYPYSIPNSDILSTNEMDNISVDSSYFVAKSFAYSSEKNESILCCCAMDEEKKYVIVQWEKSEYLIGAVDPDADMDAIWQHFRVFNETYS